MHSQNVVIFDLDGTISLCEHRRKFITNGNKDWDKFYSECVHDLPNKPVIEILNLLSRNIYMILIISGRSEKVRTETEKWLKNHHVMYDYLFMRPIADYTPDEVLKPILLEKAKLQLELLDSDIVCIFDDRDKVVNMWRKKGFTCFQVADGNF